MIKKVRITALHPDDAWFGFEPDPVGTIVTLDIDPRKRDGWSSSSYNAGLFTLDTDDLSGCTISRFKYEEVE